MEKRIIGVYLSFLNKERKNLIETLAEELGFEVRFIEDGKIKPSDIEDCEVLFGQIPTDMLKYAAKLKWLQCSFAGVDKYLADDIYPNAEVVLSNASGAYGITISEHIICVLLMLMRRMPEYGKMVQSRVWKKLPKINSIYNSKTAVVGVGDIGSNFGRRASAMGAYIVGVRKNAKTKPDWCDEIYSVSEIKSAVFDCDIVVSSLPGTTETNSIFDEEFFECMKPGSYFVNVGRGNSVDEKALYNALKSGHLAGAALDVFKTEPLPADHFLHDAPNLIITPHCAGDSALELTCDIVTDIFAQNLKHYKKGETLTTQINRKTGY